MLFTIILEFDGVNSVSQFSAPSAAAAFQKWVQGLDKPSNYALTSIQAQSVADALAAHSQLQRDVNEALGVDHDELAPLNGIKNVWCVVASSGKRPRKHVLLNIIATAPQTRGAPKRSRSKRVASADIKRSG